MKQEAKKKGKGERRSESPDNPDQSAARGVRSREERKSKQRKNRRDSEAGNRKGTRDAKTQRKQGERRAGDERIGRDNEVDLRDQGATRGNEKRRGTDSPDQSAARKARYLVKGETRKNHTKKTGPGTKRMLTQ